jgi:hypothetical protein
MATTESGPLLGLIATHNEKFYDQSSDYNSVVPGPIGENPDKKTSRPRPVTSSKENTYAYHSS